MAWLRRAYFWRAVAAENKHRSTTLPKLTKRVIDAAKPAPHGDRFVWDDALKGFGLKVTPHGVKSYVLQYRRPPGGRNSPTRRYTIGRHGSPWTPDTARTEALRLLAEVKAGHDPMAAKRAQRTASSSAVAPLTFGEVLDRFEAGYKRRSADKTMRVIRNATLRGGWQDRPVEQIARRDVIALLDGIEARGQTYLRNRVHAHLSYLFNWCVSKELVAANPATGIRKLSECSRDRVLDEDELRRVWAACDAVGRPFGLIVKLLLLTGQRRDEVGGMRWSELDLDRAMWTLPATRTKNATVHDVPLPDAVIDLLASLPHVGDFVFTLNGRAPFRGIDRAKRRLDDLSGVTDWRLHDLRRTVATGLAKLNIPIHVTERLLNHRSGTIRGVAAVYNRHDYAAERRQALEAWARRLDSIVNGGIADIALPRR
jgi:integrase